MHSTTAKSYKTRWLLFQFKYDSGKKLLFGKECLMCLSLDFSSALRLNFTHKKYMENLQLQDLV